MKLDSRLQKDCYFLGTFNRSGNNTELLLSRNAHFPWFILVPDTKETEFYKLNKDQQLLLLELINQLSIFVETHFSVFKMNIATIGNVVSQMHIHVVGRRKDDPCWPGVVWGCDHFKDYAEGVVEEIRALLGKDGASNLVSNFTVKR